MKTIFAPMATLSHEATRKLIHRYGDPDEYFSEMIHAPSFVAGGKFESWYVRKDPSPERIVWQVTGPDAGPIARASALLCALGGIGVDINMGCSAPDIARSGAGVAWMSKPLDEVALLVSGVRRAIDASARESALPRPRLSVKLRLGEAEDYPRLLSFCRALVDSGAELVTLHPRVRRDKYSRPARWSFVARLASDLPIPVYGNGDVDSPSKAFALAREFPCSGVMIGRAAIRQPWIFAAIARAAANANGLEPSRLSGEPLDHREVAVFFLDALEESQPPEFFVSRARRFFFYYCDNFSFAHHIKMKMQRAESRAEMLGLLDSYFAEVPADRLKKMDEIVGA